MICNQCGKEVTSKFCPNCGNESKLKQTEQLTLSGFDDGVISNVNETLTINENEKTLNNLHKCLNIILDICSLSEEINITTQEKAEATKSLKDNENASIKGRKYLHIEADNVIRPKEFSEFTFMFKFLHYLGWLGFIFISTMLLYIPCLIYVVIISILPIDVSQGFFRIIGLILLFGPLVIAAFKILFGFKGYFKKMIDDEYKRVAEVIPNLKKGIAQSEQDIYTMKNQLKIFCESQESKFMEKYIPKKYSSVDHITFFISIVEDKRADTLKEAINLYEDAKYKEEALALQEKSIEMLENQSKLQKEQLNALNDIQKTNIKQVRQNKKISKQVRFGNAVSVIDAVRNWN